MIRFARASYSPCLLWTEWILFFYLSRSCRRRLPCALCCWSLKKLCRGNGLPNGRVQFHLAVSAIMAYSCVSQFWLLMLGIDVPWISNILCMRFIISGTRFNICKWYNVVLWCGCNSECLSVQWLVTLQNTSEPICCSHPFIRNLACDFRWVSSCWTVRRGAIALLVRKTWHTKRKILMDIKDFLFCWQWGFHSSEGKASNIMAKYWFAALVIQVACVDSSVVKICLYCSCDIFLLHELNSLFWYARYRLNWPFASRIHWATHGSGGKVIQWDTGERAQDIKELGLKGVNDMFASFIHTTSHVQWFNLRQHRF